MRNHETLSALLENIKKEMPYIGIKPYSTNIISCNLKMIADKFGDDKANEAIRDLRLAPYGWREEEIVK